MKKHNVLMFPVAAIVVLLGLSPPQAHANHGWTVFGYQLHWARGSNLTIHAVDHISPDWQPFFNQARRDWHRSKDVNVVNPDDDTCDPDWNCMEVFNGDFGPNGWLGLASVSGYIDFDNDMIHLTYGQAIMNDYYFNNVPFYDTPEWRAVVMCQEIGHVFGLAHNDEDFNNPPTGTCMDYSIDPASNQHPDEHDMEQLAEIYDHNDVVIYNANPGSAAFQNQAQIDDFGALVENDEHQAVYMKMYGDNEVKITLVTYAGQH